MQFIKKNVIIVVAVIIFLLLGIFLINNQSKKNQKTSSNTPVRDFNEIKESPVTPTKTPTSTPTVVFITPTSTPTSTPTPTLIPTLIPTTKTTSIPKSTKPPTPTPTPDTSIKSTGVSLSVTELRLEVDQSHQILSRVEPNETTDKSLTWSSDNANVAIVDNSGMVTAKSVGEANIMAKTSNNKTTFVKVYVINKLDQTVATDTPRPTSTPIPSVSIYPTKIFLNYSSLKINKGEYAQLRANIEPIGVSDLSTTWISSDANIAIVDVRGRVTAKSDGNVEITGKTVNGLEAKVNISVISKTQNSPTNTPTNTSTNTPTKTSTSVPTKSPTKAPTSIPTSTTSPTKITLAPPTLTLNVSNTYEMYTKVEPVNSSNKTITWSSSNSKVATVNSKGLVTAVSSGKTTITAKTSNNLTATSTVNVLVSSGGSPPDNSNQNGEYKLVWSDEFNGTSLDTTKWLAVTNCADHWNDESQCYTADAISLSNGNLVIKSERRNLGGFNFTSGMIKTDGSTMFSGNITTGVNKFSARYGRFEFRAQLPAGGQGVWPAIWLLPPPYSNPPEVDIVEVFSDSSTIWTNYWWQEGGVAKQGPTNYKNPSPNSFHIFTFEWEPGVFRWYFDGELKRTLSSSVVTDIPMSILINTALGGKGTGPVSSSTAFPQYFLIDYVRVYQKQ